MDEIQKPAQDIFSQLDEYDWAKKQVKSHNRLAKMAKNLTMEIDSMFDVEKEEKEDKEEEHKYSSTEDLDFMKTIESLIPAYDAPADRPLPVYKPFSMSQKKQSPNKKSTPELEKKLEALPQEDITPVIERKKSNAARRHTVKISVNALVKYIILTRCFKLCIKRKKYSIQTLKNGPLNLMPIVTLM